MYFKLQESFKLIIDKSVEDLRSDSIATGERLSSLESRISAIEASSSVNLDTSQTQDMFAEFDNRRKLAKNIIVYNFRGNGVDADDLNNFNDLLRELYHVI